MKKIKSLLALMTAVLLIMSCFTACGGESEPTETDDGNGVGEMVMDHIQQKEEQATAAGSQSHIGADGLAEIYTVEDLMEFMDVIASGYQDLDAILMADLDLSGVCGEAVGDWIDATYAGTFDGNGHTITGLYKMGEEVRRAGFFSSISVGGTVKNLNMENVHLRSTEYAGAIAASCFGTIDNCTASGELTGVDLCVATDEDGAVGGIVGMAGDDSVITNCTSTANLSAVCALDVPWGCGGGIAGISGGEVSNCTNSGNIDFMEGSCGGGIVGSSEGAILTDCRSSGDVRGFYQAGGVLGFAGPVEMSRCGNTGSVEGPQYAGGIIGACSKNKTSHVDNCFNKGQIRSTPWEDESMSLERPKIAAGLTGRINGFFTNCYNNGTIIYEDGGENYFVSGMVGECISNKNRLLNCYSNGELVCNSNGEDTCRYAVGAISPGSTYGLHYLEGYQKAYAGSKDSDQEAASIKTAEAFLDGTVLLLLRDYTPVGGFADVEVQGLDTWIQGEDGPCFNWE